MKTKQLIDFKNSFKPNLLFLKVILFDLLFYLITIPTFIFIGNFLTKQTSKLDLTALEQQLISPELSSQVQHFFTIFILTIAAIVIITLAAWSLSRALIYTTILKKRLTLKYFFKFAALNLIFAIVALIILVFFGTLVAAAPKIIYLFYAVVLIAAYFILLAYYFFTKKNEIFNAIGTALTIGATKLSQLFLPCLLILAVLAILSLLTLLLSILGIIMPPFISLLIFTVFLAWARLYFIPQVEKIK